VENDIIMNNQILVIVPHFYCHRWLSCCVNSHAKQASGKIRIVVVDMSHSKDEIIRTVGACYDTRSSRVGVEVVWIPHRPEDRSTTIPTALARGMIDAKEDIIVFSDSDIIMIRNGWDDVIRSMFLDGTTGIVSATFREGSLFGGVVEWNWMAHSRGVLKSDELGTDGMHDYGHRYQRDCLSRGYQIKTFDTRTIPVPGKSSRVSGDKDGPFVFHEAYGSRRSDPGLEDCEYAWILSDNEEREMMDRFMP
jgi:hypothetical protein